MGVRAVTFNEDVRAELYESATALGYAADVIEGVLITIARDIGRVYDELTLRPPGHPERRTYLTVTEGLGLVEAVCEDQDDEVVVINLRVGAFS